MFRRRLRLRFRVLFFFFFRGFEVSRSGVGVEAWVRGPDLGVEVESVSLLRPSSSFSARVCSSGGPVPVGS